MTPRPCQIPSTPGRLARLAGLVLAVGAVLLSACGGEETYTITDVRRVSGPAPGSGGMPPGHPPVGPDAGGAPSSRTALSWKRPEGWAEHEARGPFLAVFVPEGTTKTKCSVMVMGTMAGDARSYVNRWRGEAGLPELSEEAFADLEQIEALGRQGPLAEIEAAEGDERWTLLAFVLETESEVLLVKMMGPSAEVGGEGERFRAFCRSLRAGEQ
jgi:hypothetical protein